MKTRSSISKNYLLQIVIFTISIVLMMPLGMASNLDKELSLTYSDEFNESALGTKWAFINPAPNPGGQSYSLSMSPGFLSMITTGPTDLIFNTDTAPKIMESAPVGDYEIVTRVLADPDVSFEHAGILIYENVDNWVRVIRDSNSDSIMMQQQMDGGFSQIYIPFSGSDVILKVTKTSDSYEGSFSTNGVDFMSVGTFGNPFTPSSIGLTVVSTPIDNVFRADFDYFRVSAVPEPKTYALLIAGLGLLVFIGGRRKESAV